MSLTSIRFLEGDQRQGENSVLEGLAVARFKTLTLAEIKLLRAAPSGRPAYCGPSMRADDPTNDPGRSDIWGAERQIRAELVRWLCLDRRARDYVAPRGILILAAKLTGVLDLSHATVPFPLALWRCVLTHEANLRSVEIRGLDLQQSRIRSLQAEGAKIKESVLLRDVRADGSVSLARAQVGGNLECDRAALMGGRIALFADGMQLEGTLFLRHVHAEGEVRLLNAQIGRSLECDGGHFKNTLRKDVPESGNALSADGVSVRGEVFLRNGFLAEGEVRLVNAQIGGDLECQRGTFLNLPKSAQGPVLLGEMGTVALRLDGVGVKGSVRLRDGFHAEGLVELESARIGGDLDSARGEFESAILDLKDASVGSIIDDERSWPRQGRLYLDGFVYARIAGGPRDIEPRLKWLSLQPKKPFTPQPYVQLAKIFRDAGDGNSALTVLVEMERRRREYQYHTRTATLESWVLRETIGYGYNPGRSIWAIAALSGLGWIIYRRSYLAGNIVPTDKDAYQSFRRDGKPPTHYRAFAPLIYSVENSLPLVKLGQADQWQPDPNVEGTQSQSISWPSSNSGLVTWTWLRWLQRLLAFCGLESSPNPQQPQSRRSRWGTSSRFLRWFLWVQVLLGWLLATLFLAGVTGIVRKE